MKSRKFLPVLVIILLVFAAAFGYVYTRQQGAKSTTATANAAQAIADAFTETAQVMQAIADASTATARVEEANATATAKAEEAAAGTSTATARMKEQPVELILIEDAVADGSSEISGMAWHGDVLILLPQYPDQFGEGHGALLAIPKMDILAYLDGKSSEPLTPTRIKLSAEGLDIPGFQGYEAIAFYQDKIFLTIEAGEGADMRGYLISGIVEENEIKLDTSNIAEIPLPIASENHTNESLVVIGDKVLTFYELNGADLVPQPAAQVFDLDLNLESSIPLPNLEYRLTDAAFVDGKIWVINYFFPGDIDMLPKVDPLAEAYGEGKTHAQYEQVERLVELNYNESGMTLTNFAPIQMTLEEDARNWEGLVLLDQRGFLVVTDRFPATLLGFVKMP